MPIYVALIRKEPGTDYWADMPDIPGCVSDGDTPEGALAHFEEALKLHLEALDTADLRSPRTLFEIDDRDFVEAWSVDVDLTTGEVTGRRKLK